MISTPTIHYSADKKLYYCTYGRRRRPWYWFSVEKIPGPVPEEKRCPRGPFSPNWLQIDKDEGETYHRKALGFTFWEVESGESKPVSVFSDEFLDYATHHQWKLSMLHRLLLRFPFLRRASSPAA